MYKFIILGGIILIIIGILVYLLEKAKFPFFPFKLPGDIFIKKGNFCFYFPLASCLLISIILSLILWFLKR